MRRQSQDAGGSVREAKNALYLATVTVAVAIAFVAYALTGADLCVWYVGK